MLAYPILPIIDHEWALFPCLFHWRLGGGLVISESGLAWRLVQGFAAHFVIQFSALILPRVVGISQSRLVLLQDLVKRGKFFSLTLDGLVNSHFLDVPENIDKVTLKSVVDKFHSVLFVGRDTSSGFGSWDRRIENS